ncbi:DNA helicase MCM9 [Cheilinus undulatus]|uniref:DNA helicase MCM9 n=1 Tax=Cheilinus undulatus TaxID=241271 RepID=UPI001BD3A7DB|nr:DNA helicase MCM9 [Cheilinus undulatus]
MLISPEQEALIGRVFESYLTEHHHDDILLLFTDDDDDEETRHSVVVNAMTLFEANMEVGDYFNAYPHDVLAIFDKVLHKTALELAEKALLKQRLRHAPHARITGLPMCPELTRDTIPRSRDVGHFLSVTGTVIRTSVAKVLEYERDYMCNKCRHVFTVQADFDQFYTFVPPVSCPNPDICNSFKFTCLTDGSEPGACRDYQEIKIQEQVQRLSVGSIPRSMAVVLENDLVDSCKSGDDVTVYGVMCQRWKPFYDGSRCDVELVLKANNIEVNNQQAAAALLMKDVQKEFEEFWDGYKHDPIAGRNQILLSLCPQVFGMYVVKLAVAMVLAGGVQRIDPCGTKIRGECHMLLVGDPGTGKSQFLKYSTKIMPRSVLTAGIGSTSAGLTVAAVRDGGEWHLEAGALVLSDGGLCCIDEFNSIKEHDRISIHEAMEQQSISVAKAGMVCKLNTRTTILAAANPKGQYDPNEPLSVNVALASPLLSRFDLVLVLLDTKNSEWDRIISSFILEDRGLPAESSGLWSMEKMKAYFSVIKRLQPQLSEDANIILTRYYQLQRQSDGRNAARTTIRMLESLSRLAEAHARLMFRETVTIEDAVMAVSVMECSMQGGALLGNVNALLTSFPAEPCEQYHTQCRTLLQGLNLPQLLKKEISRLTRMKRDASGVSPPADDHQHQCRDTNSAHSTKRHDITVEGGLDWFHSINQSVSPEGLAPPIITSTQVKLNTSANLESKETNDEAITHKDISRRFTSSSDEERQNERSKEKQEKKKGCEGQRESPESSEFVFQRVSKKLRERRLKELSHHQEPDSERGGAARAESGDKHVTNTTSESHRSSSLSSHESTPSNHPVKDLLSTVTGQRPKDKTGTKRAEDEPGEELRSKLSSFIFKPRKMNASAHGDELDVSTGILDEGTTTQTNVSAQCRDVDSDTARRTREERAADQDETEKKTRVSGVRGSDMKSAPERTDTVKTAVASSTLAKLSRFSFSCRSEPTATAQPGEDKNRQREETERADGAGGSIRPVDRIKNLLTLGQRDQQGAEPLHQPADLLTLRQRDQQRAEPPHHTADLLTLKQRDQQGAEPLHQTLLGLNPVETGKNIHVDPQSSAGVKKRKCFELGRGLSGSGTFSLFGSDDFSNDVLDTDWDQEVSKRARI